MVCFAALPPFFGMAKSELFYIPSFGTHLRRAGFIRVRRNRTDDLLAAYEEAASKLKSGAYMQIFPEGTRTVDGKIKKFKIGAFKLAVQANVPVIPVTISGTFELLPKDRFLISSKIKNNIITVKILNAIYPDQSKDKKTAAKELMSRAWEQMSGSSEEF
ncbi:MAG: 1-acyl-sn-glycerol-3-phosphate acyltransferase, partial [Actinomycetia bacterium]|nr:1-acyl-sn-glycerol-3-phosphate acyltransferase [Actinomycetes bacterium]